MKRTYAVAALCTLLLAGCAASEPRPGTAPDGPVARYVRPTPSADMEARIDGELVNLDGCIAVVVEWHDSPVIPVFPEPVSWDSAADAVVGADWTLLVGSVVSLGGGFVELDYELPSACPIGPTFLVSTVVDEQVQQIRKD